MWDVTKEGLLKSNFQFIGAYSSFSEFVINGTELKNRRNDMLLFFDEIESVEIIYILE